MSEYPKSSTIKKQRMGVRNPYGLHAKISEKKIPQSLTPGKDTGGSPQKVILPPYGKRVSGTSMSREFNKGPVAMGKGRWSGGTRTSWKK